MWGLPKCSMILPVVLPLLIFIGFSVKRVNGFHTSGMCVQVGQANLNAYGSSGNQLTTKERQGYYTIGTKKFDTTHAFLDNSYGTGEYDSKVQDCPYSLKDKAGNAVGPWWETCPGGAVKIRTYSVFQDGVIMNGWLHFEVELTTNDQIMGIYVQVRDEYYNAVGEFVLKEDEQCPSTTPGLGEPSPYQILPCSAVGFREAKLSNALFLVQEELLNYKPLGRDYLTKTNISKGIHFTWRLSEYWCNRHLRIRPDATILTKSFMDRNVWKPCATNIKAVCGPYRKAAEYWIHHGWYGTADIKKKNSQLDCTKPVIDYDTGKFTKDASGKNLASWFLEPYQSPDPSKEESRPLKSQLKNDYFFDTYPDPTTGYATIMSCQADTRKAYKGAGKPGVAFPSFAGRCKHHFEKDPSHDAFQGCISDATAVEFQNLPYDKYKFEPYTDYVQTLTVNRTKLCSVPCYPPQDKDLDDIKGYEDRSGESKFTVVKEYNSASRNEARVEKLWVGRKYHAMLATVWTMFLAPVGIFAARYLKESYMNHSCTGMHIWFWIHVATAVTATWLFVSSISGIWSNLSTWGRSTHPSGIQHRLIGYGSMSAFALMILLGGFRCGHDPKRKLMRIAFMLMHSLCGFLIYFLNVIAMMMSTWIPASPSMDMCDGEGEPVGTSRVLVMSISWLAIDIGFHVLMTTMQLVIDRKAGITRPWYCPIVPIMPSDSTQDLVGSGLRKIMFFVYMGVAGIMTSATVGIIADNELNETCKNLTGPSTCTENSVYGCSSYVKAYLGFVTKESDTTESGTYAVKFV